MNRQLTEEKKEMTNKYEKEFSSFLERRGILT